jgi:hypothetical protein
MSLYGEALGASRIKSQTSLMDLFVTAVIFYSIFITSINTYTYFSWDKDLFFEFIYLWISSILVVMQLGIALFTRKSYMYALISITYLAMYITSILRVRFFENLSIFPINLTIDIIKLSGIDPSFDVLHAGILINSILFAFIWYKRRTETTN